VTVLTSKQKIATISL